MIFRDRIIERDLKVLQVVVYEGVVREKPSNEEEAHHFIKGYSGKHAATVSFVYVTNLKTGFTNGDYDKAEVGKTDGVTGLSKALIVKLLKEAVKARVLNIYKF